MPKYDLKGVRIQGGFFVDPVCLDFFIGSQCRAVTLYGKNGSGKTSIARAINELSPEFSDEKDFSACFYDQQGADISSDDQGFKICVFSDWFKNQNMHFEKARDGLGSIVLFGKSKELDTQIEDLSKQNKDNQAKIDNEVLKRFDDPTKSSYLIGLEENVKSVARKTWCVRDKEIHKKQNATRLSDDVFLKLCSVQKPSDDLAMLQSKFQNELVAIQDINGDTPFLQMPPSPPLASKKDSELCLLLSKQIEKRSASQFESAIIKALQDHGSSFVHSSDDFASDPTSNPCPFCLQEVSVEQKRRIHEAIQSVFDSETKKETSSLESALLPSLVFDVSSISEHIPPSTMVQLERSIAAYNDICNRYNALIRQKMDSIYKPVVTSRLGLEESKKQFEIIYQTIFKIVSEINLSIKEYKNRVGHLSEINDQMAYYELFDSLSLLNKTRQEKKEAEDRVASLAKQIADNTQKINEINASKANTKIALDEINHQLFTIFSSRTRLYLSESGIPSEYSIYSNGHKIRFDKLSDGEKNAISLVYFFETLKSGCQAGVYFSNPCFVILDDPISSFDFDNKLGVLSYLRGAVSEVFSGNSLNKVAIFSHELDIVYSVNQIYKDICEYYSSILLNQRMFYLSKKHCTKPLSENDFSTYRLLIDDVYEFACSDLNGEPNEDADIGNEIRKLLEAYGTFNYRCSMNDLLRKPEYLDKIKDVPLRSYFKDRMFRLVLNSSSHTQNVVSSIPDTFSFDLFSFDEKVKTARDILVYLYQLDPQHITRYLNSNPSACPNPQIVKIESWKQDIQTLLK